MQGFIVVMECLGAGLPPDGADGRRVPVREHAYDLDTATLAGHPPGTGPRVGFPSCQRAVQGIVRDLIATAVTAITSQLLPPGTEPP